MKILQMKLISRTTKTNFEKPENQKHQKGLKKESHYFQEPFFKQWELPKSNIKDDDTKQKTQI